MINIDSALKQTVQMLKKMSPPAGLEVLSYKRNRAVVILRQASDRFLVEERGYYQHSQTLSFEELEKNLRIIFRREFPRSRKVRVYRLGGPQDLGQKRKKL